MAGSDSENIGREECRKSYKLIRVDEELYVSE